MDTIFAPLTPRGNCSIYVLRISGDRAVDCIKKLGIDKKLKHREATLCVLKDPDGKPLDEALVIYFSAPHSFTGEDVVELNLHCSGYIIAKVFSLLLGVKGVRMAERGEFSKRAFLNGKMDLMQAESIADLIKSETELQHKLAISQLQGKNSNFYNRLREKIVEILSLLEAFIDFPEEDIPQDLSDEMGEKIKSVMAEIRDNLNDNRIGEKIRDGLHVAIIGEPNSGKSTLLNYLSKRDIAIVSDIAGTTRDIIEVNMDIAGIPVVLYDTAGIRETKDVIESEGVHRALKKAQEADLKILVASVENPGIDKKIAELMDNNTIILLNKIDLRKKLDFEKLPFEKGTLVEVSLKNNTNLNTFLTILREKLETMISPHMNTTITNERYRRELMDALEHLEEFDPTSPLEINTENIRLAANHIGKITGKINSEEILDNIFSKFCIGK